MKIEELASMISKKRGQQGVRAAAKEIGISPTTFIRIEKGHVPDVGTLQKVCGWLGEEPARFTGIGALQIAFKNKKAVPNTTAKSLATLIEMASKQFAEQIESVGH